MDKILRELLVEKNIITKEEASFTVCDSCPYKRGPPCSCSGSWIDGEYRIFMLYDDGDIPIPPSQWEREVK